MNNLLVSLLLWLILDDIKSAPNDVIICNSNICPADKHHNIDGTCSCCLVCESAFRRKNGTNSCPLSHSDCSDECIAGYRNQQTLKGDHLDICIPDDKTTVTTEVLEKEIESNTPTPSGDKNDRSNISIGSVIGGVIGIGALSIASLYLFVIYKRCKRYRDDETSSENSIVEDSQNVQGSGCNTPEKVAVEDTDVTAMDNDSEIIVNTVEDNLQRSQPIDEHEANSNQTFGLNPNDVWAANEMPSRVSEIPTAPNNDHRGFTPTYPTNPTAHTADSVPESVTNGLNNTQGTLTNIRVKLDVTANLSVT